MELAYLTRLHLFSVSSVSSVVPLSAPLRGLLRAFVSFVVAALPLTLNAQTRFDPPPATYDSPTTLRSLKSALDANPAEAATSIEAILKNQFDDLTRIDPQTILSVPVAIDSLEPNKREKVLAEYRRLYDADAQNAYDDARERDAGSIEALCTVAQRYALASIAPRAYAEAAQRAAKAGDAATALTLDRLATSAGWKGDEAHAALMKAMTALVSPSPATYRAPLPFDAPWFSRPDHAGLSKSIPLAFDGTLYFAGPRHVLALRESGQLSWRFAAAEQWTSSNTLDRSITAGRGPILTVAAFASPTAPQVLIVRQPRGFTRDMAIRALRASDGKLLWSTDANPALDNITFAGNPAVAGRYVYSVAISTTDNQRSLLLVALDLLDGGVIFKRALGAFTAPQRGTPQWEAFSEQTEPAIAEDVIYLTPGVGAAFAIGRFDGRLRWTTTYETTPHPARQPGMGQTPRALRDIPVDPAILLRYRGTPHVAANILLIAPQDTTAAFALDRHTGRQLWKSQSPPGHTLVASSDSLALFASVNSIGALDATTGEAKWTWNPAPANVRLSGPPVQLADTLYIPTSDGRIATISVSTGKTITAPVKSPALRPLLATDPARRAIDDAFLLRSFTTLPTTAPATPTP